MKTETRVYLVDYSDSPLPDDANRETLQSMSNERFMDCAEGQGYVFTLEGFVTCFCQGGLPDYDCSFVRIIEVETA